MRYNPIKADAELIRAHTAKRGAIYRELSFRTITRGVIAR